jgi:competence protein ComEC
VSDALERPVPPRWSELRLLPAALGAWAAGGVLIGLDPDAPFLAIVGVLWAVAALAVLAAFRFRGFAMVSLALTAAALVASVVAAQAPTRAPSGFPDASSGAVTLEFDVTAPVVDGRVPVRAWVPERLSTGSAAVLLFLDGSEQVRVGERATVSAVVRRVPPGDDVAFLAFAEGPVSVLVPAPPGLALASGLREGLRAVSGSLPGPGAQLLPGLAVGDTSRVDAELDADMKNSSLSHLTAVSGANCAIVVGAVFAICAALGMRRGARVAVSLAALAGFVVLVTPEPSVLRAAVMGGIVLLALAAGRPARGVPALCLAVVVLLVIDPWLARSYGFALSALATAGLLLLAAPLAASFGRWMPRPLALVIAVPLAAQLACQPVLLMLSPTLPLWGVPANLLAAPAAPLATVIGLIACLLVPWMPPVAAALASIAWMPASWIAGVAAFFASLPGARLPWPGGPLGITALVALTVVALAAILGPAETRVRRVSAALALIGALGYVGAVVGVRVVQLVTRPPDWQYAMCDVGQGDATLIRSGGHVALVDTGADPELLAACLDDLGIGSIDLLVLTHFDLDHVGGADAVIGGVGTALVGPVGEPDDERLRDELRASGARIVDTAEGMTGSLGDLAWRALWPPPRGVEPGNPASIALLIEPRDGCSACLSALMLGDLGEESQLRMRGVERIPSVDVLKVAHHGSGDFSDALYADVSASVALIGVGADNDYGHPTPRALEALTASGTASFRTDRDGLILVAPPEEPGEPPRVWTARTSVVDAQ